MSLEETRHEKFKRYKLSGSSSFNTTQPTEGCFNLNDMAKDEEEEDVQEVRPTGKDKTKKKGTHHPLHRYRQQMALMKRWLSCWLMNMQLTTIRL